jgi:hypothetical protein
MGNINETDMGIVPPFPVQRKKKKKRTKSVRSGADGIVSEPGHSMPSLGMSAIPGRSLPGRLPSDESTMRFPVHSVVATSTQNTRTDDSVASSIGTSSVGKSSGTRSSSLRTTASGATIASQRPPVPTLHSLNAGVRIDPYKAPPTTLPVNPDAKAKYSKMFATTPINPEQLTEVDVIVPKHMRHDAGHKQFITYQDMATESIEHKFGVASHYVSGKEEAEEGDQTRPQFIQQQFVGNLSKMDAVYDRVQAYDMVDILGVPLSVRDPAAADITTMFDYQQVNILTNWDPSKITWETTCLWQWAINTWMKSPDRESSRWLRMLLRESCTTEMRNLIDTKYNKLPDAYRGGITYSYILSEKLFSLNRDTTAAMRKFIQMFVEKGLRMYKGENMVVASKELLAVSRRLYEAKELPVETPTDVLTGLCICSVSEFKSLHEHCLQEQKRMALTHSTRPSQDDAFDHVVAILTTAVQYYDSLNMSSSWVLPRNRAHAVNAGNQASGGKKEITCWNCGKPGCHPDRCPQPRDDKKIAEARKKWMESKNGSRDGGRSRSKGTKSNTYERDKWSPPSASNPSSIRYFNEVPHAWCKKKCNGTMCGWNTTHSTSYHAAWTVDPNYSLKAICPTHQLVLAQQATTKPPRPPVAAPSVSRQPATNSTELINVLNAFEDNCTTDKEQALLASVKAALRLN